MKTKISQKHTSSSFFLIFFSISLFIFPLKNTYCQQIDSLKNAIVKENNISGTREWKLSNPATNREIEGYASATSINKGDSIKLYINTAADNFSYKVYRMGWYQGLGGRLIKEHFSVKGTIQKMPKLDSVTGLIECNWINPITINTEENWTSGVYLVKLEENVKQKQSYIIFVVRNDNRPSDIIFQLPVTTYQAYNYWGGKSLYRFGSGKSLPWGSSDGNAATKVTFDRPYALNTNIQVANTVGSGEFFANLQPVSRGYPISSSAWDYNMVRWLEKNGYDVSYSTNIDTHTSPKKLNKHKVFLSNGHDEYWSKQMRDNIRKARNKGINLAFFGANNMYWQVRFESNSAKTNSNRIMVCYKGANSKANEGVLSTVMFRQKPISNPESKLLGVQFFSEPIDGDIIISNANHPIFKGTGLKNGDKLKGLLGYEVDGITAHSPKNIEVLTSSKAINKINKDSGKTFNKKMIKAAILKLNYFWIILSNLFFLFMLFIILKWFYKKRLIKSKLFLPVFMTGAFMISLFSVFMFHEFNQNHFSHMTIYKAKSGAKVFSTGTIQWSWGLDDYNVPELRTSRYNKDAERITQNVLELLDAKPSKKL